MKNAILGNPQELFIRPLLLVCFLLSLSPLLFAQPASISGFVTDSTNGNALIGANIYLEGNALGSSSNDEGYYVIHPISPGDYTLICSYLGYLTHKEPVHLRAGEKLFLKIALAPHPITTEAVVVTAEAAELENDITLGKVELSSRTIRQSPQLGEADLFRTLQALPGIVSENDFSTGLVVRGGNTDQNLIMLDGITVYNPSHLGGLFSNFLLDATKEARFVKGGFSAEYGGRMSSVLDVISKEGNRKKFSGAAGVSLLSSRLSLEFPVSDGAVLIAGRRTYFDQALKIVNKNFPYYFYDLQGSFFQDLSKYDRLTISGYFGNDVLDWDEFEFNFRWGNRALSAHWQHVFSPQLFSHFMVAGSRFNTSVQLGGNQGIDSNNEILDYTLKGDLSYFSSQDNGYKFGFEFKKLHFKYQNDYDNQNRLSIKQTPLSMAFYLQNHRKIGKRLLIFPGLRFSYFSRSNKKVYVEPRLSIKQKLGHKEYLSFSAGLYRQFIFTVRDEFSSTIINDWFAIDRTVPAGKSWHFIAGYERELWSTTRLQIEVYYKTMNNMLTYRETRSSVAESIGEDLRVDKLFVPTQGYSYGFEFFLHKQYGKLAGWIGYTLNWARSELDNLRYYSSYDRRHDLKVLLSYDLGRSWRLGSRFNYGGGFPYTRALGTYQERDDGVVKRRIIYSDRNAFRFPAYIRWDMSLTKYFHWFDKYWWLDIQVVNVMNRDNIFFYNWDFNENPAVRDDITMLPLVPTIGISVEF